MKKLLTIWLFITVSFIINAQEQEEVCDCPRPKDGKFFNICTLVENHDFQFKKELMAMSCADPKIDSPEIIKAKVNCMWGKYYKEFGCEGQSFITDGNILKFSIYTGFDFFIDGVVKDFGLNINLIDPADGKSLMDFLSDQRESYRGSVYPAKFAEYDRLYKLFESKGAKHAKDLKN